MLRIKGKINSLTGVSYIGLISCSSVLFLLFTAFILAPSFADNQVTATTGDSGISTYSTTTTPSVGISLPSSIAFDSVLPTTDGATTIASADLTVTTTNSASYSLYLYSSEGDNSLKSSNPANISSIIATQGDVGLTLSNLESNTWGYSLGTSVPDDTTTYSAVPTDSATPIQTKDTSDANSANDTYRLAFGAKVDSTISSGSYSNTLTIAIIAEPGGIPITYDANGGHFNNDPTQTTDVVRYTIGQVSSSETKIARTPNISDDGLSTGGYGDSVEDTQIVTFPGASSLKVTVSYQTESTNYDWLAIYDGSVTPSRTNYSDSITGKLGGSSKVENEVFIIPGDTAQFYFRSDSSSSNYYGYYAEVQEYPSITSSAEVQTPVRPGYTFLGWYKDIEGTAGNEFIVDASLKAGTIYAKWAKDLTITFNGNGNTGGSMEDQAVAYNGRVTLNANGYTKPGYTFTGWNTEADGTGTTYRDKATINYTDSIDGDTLTLYAQWAKDLTITFNGNGNTGGSMEDQAVAYNGRVTLNANGYTKPGYTFTGWNTEADGTGTTYRDKATYRYSSLVDGDTLTLYAQWAKDLTITFNGNGNTGGIMEDQAITYNGSVALRTNSYTKSGYVFFSWNTKADGTGMRFDDETTISYPGTFESDTITLYAQWAKVLGGYIQNFTRSQCASQASSQPVSVTDIRDGNQYTLRYIGNICWMIDNLQLDGDKTLNSSTSNVSSNWYFPDNSLTAGDTYTEARWARDSTHGNYYNYCAVSAGTVCDSVRVDATQDICPAGWHLPTHDELLSVAPLDDSWSKDEYPPAFSAPFQVGYYWDGRFYDSGGAWWSSDAVSSTSQDSLVHSHSLGGTAGASLIQREDKSRGVSARCVRSN